MKTQTCHGGLVARAVAARQLGISVPTLDRWARAGIGPKRIKIGPRAVRYRQADIDEWIATRSAA